MRSRRSGGGLEDARRNRFLPPRVSLCDARRLVEVQDALRIPVVFKGSFDKANRRRHDSYRGPGLHQGLTLLDRVKSEFQLPVLTDVHEVWQCKDAGEVADVVQVPAFLCRQTDLLVAAGHTGRIVNVKRGQFAAPEVAVDAAVKVHEAAKNPFTLLTDRGTTLGYEDLVVDLRNVPKMQLGDGTPSLVLQDLTHSVQQPGGARRTTGGHREFIPTIGRAAAAAGVDGLFIEV